jgi:hypothetical protein
MIRRIRDIFARRERWNAGVSLLAPPLVAAIVVTGLLSLSLENVSGALAVREAHRDHTAAVQRLFFRP